MTIASFCHAELASGPLTLDELASRAAIAGVTRARDPRRSVRDAIRYGSSLELPSELWVSPRWLLEGRCFTARGLPLRDALADEAMHPWDLLLLERITKTDALPLASGGTLRKDRWYGGSWACDRPLPSAGPDELLCFRGVGGALEVSVVPEASTATLEAARIRRELDRLELPGRYGATTAGDVALVALAQLVVDDPALLRVPAPPLSDLASGLRAKDDARAEEEIRWMEDYRPPLSLDQWTYKRLGEVAASDGLSREEWVTQAVLDGLDRLYGGPRLAPVRELS